MNTGTLRIQRTDAGHYELRMEHGPTWIAMQCDVVTLANLCGSLVNYVYEAEVTHGQTSLQMQLPAKRFGWPAKDGKRP